MRAVDTNVLVRLVTRDDARQVEAAEGFVANGAWVSHLALAEASWVLGAVYQLKPPAVARAIEMLLHHQQLTLQDAETVSAALEAFRKRPTLGFSDCLLLEVARKAGHLPLGTFDRTLAKLEGASALQAINLAA
ncbi:MAG: PIN domain-containing protein [Betaproteobacteria bacterium]